MKVLWRLIGYNWRYRWFLVGALAATMVTTLFSIATPWLLGSAIDEVLSSGLRSRLLMLAGAILLVSILRGVSSYFEQYLTESVSFRVEADLRNGLVTKLQSLSFGYHDRQWIGDLMTRSTTDVDEATRVTDEGLLAGLSSLFLLGAIAPLMLITNLHLGLIGLAVVPLLIWLSAAIIPREVETWTQARSETGHLNSLVHENLTGMRVVKAFGARNHEQAKFQRVAFSVATLNYIGRKIFMSRDIFSFFASYLAIAAVLWFGGREVIRGDLSAGQLATFILFSLLLQRPISFSGYVFSAFSRGYAAGQRIFGILDAESPVKERAEAITMPRVRGNVKFEQVSVKYGSEGNALRNVDIEVMPGQLIALLGPPGSGKSTVANLIPRFYDVSTGRVVIDGYDVQDVTLDSLRQNVGIVLQDTFAFAATIKDNIAYGRENASMDDIVRAAKVAHLHDFIESLPKGYDTMVGERGITLSGGQRQRLAIARTILLDPPILILDDSTSSVDMGTEHQIQEALSQVAKGRTTFVIAHRLSTVREADLIVVLENGEVVERGTHDELLSRDSHYRRIYDLQIRPRNEEAVSQAEIDAITSRSVEPPMTSTAEGLATAEAKALDDGETPPLHPLQLFFRVLSYLGPHRRQYFLGMVGLVATIGLASAMPWFIKLGIDGYVTKGDLSGLNRIAIILGSVTIAWGVIYYGYQRMLRWLDQRILYALRMDVFQHLQRLSMSFYDRNSVGRVMSRAQGDVEQVEDFLLFLNRMEIRSVMLVIFGISMLIMDLRLGLITVGVTLLLLPIMSFWLKYSLVAFVKVRSAIADVNARIQENLAGIRVVQSLSREQVNIHRFADANVENLYANLKASRFLAVLRPTVDTVTGLALALVVFFGGDMVLRGTLGVGVLVAFAIYIDRYSASVYKMTTGFGGIHRGMVSASRLFQLLDVKPEVVETPDAVKLPQVRGELRYEGVGFHYIPGIPVLSDIDLHVRAGETVALVGSTGAGKTTVVSLLLRYYDVNQGRITVDGHDIRQVTQDSLAMQMGVVLQEPFLFSGTLKENIRYNRTEATDEEVVIAAQAVGAHEFITRLEHSYDTPLQERGVNLSVGQRQLVSFARALVANPRILILDEATANIDTQSEMLVQEALDDVLRDRTALIIAHRLSTVRNADRIVVMDQGRIVEQGTHDQLMASDGLYARLQSYTSAAGTV